MISGVEVKLVVISFVEKVESSILKKMNSVLAKI